MPTGGSERPRIGDAVLGRDLHSHLRATWAFVLRRTFFPSKNDKTWLGKECELVDLVTKLFR